VSDKPPSRKAARFSSRQAYREYQVRVAREAILPVLGRLDLQVRDRRVLDLGCGDGGLTEVLEQEGARVIGLDRDGARLAFVESACVAGDATTMPFASSVFDVVIAHDIVEHVRPFGSVLSEIERVLAPGGRALVTFPPYFGPFGGHQQGVAGPARVLAYGHLLPRPLWLSIVGSPQYERMYGGLARLSISAFERALAGTGLRVRSRLFYLVRPEVAVRMGIRSVECPFLGAFGVLREFLSGAVFYLLEKGHSDR
jgi:SAM-dependent methyltransferase